MLAVIKTGGKQYLVSPGDKIKIEKINQETGKEIVFDEVLLVVNNQDKVKIGTPLVEGAQVKGKVVSQGQSKKITILKYRPKKRYQKKKGHRQPFTEVEISKIIVGS